MGCIKSLPEREGEDQEATEIPQRRSQDTRSASESTVNPIGKSSFSETRASESRVRRESNSSDSTTRSSESKTDRSAARSNLKALLNKAGGTAGAGGGGGGGSGERSSESGSRPVSLVARSSSMAQKVGKCGWLYRKNEDSMNESDQFIQLWAVLAENKLTYYSQKPTAPVGDAEPIMPRGYLIVDRGGHCTTADEHNLKSGGMLSGQGRNCFLVTEPQRSGGGAPISVVFSGSSDSDRYDWMEKLVEAFEGTKHEPPVDRSSPRKSIPSPSKASSSQTKRGSDASMVAPVSQAELPKLTGALKKKAVGGTFGVKTVKKRFFRLEAGELRYYEGEQMKPSQLKGTVQISGCKLVPEKEKVAVTIEMPDGKCLEMEADSEADARRWAGAIQETITILSGAGSGGKKDKKRREDVTVEKITEKTTSSMKSTAKDPLSFKTEATKSFLKASLQDHFLLGGLENFDPLIDSLKLVVGLPGDVIIWQDTLGDLFYVLETGSTQIFKGDAFVGSMSPGTAFGELALINDVKRAATIRIDFESRLWSLDRPTFRRVLANQESSTKDEKISFLRNIKIFEKLHDLSLTKLADALNTAKFQAGLKIFKQGDTGNCFYIVHRGTVALTKGSTELARLGSGSSFGELALIKDEPRAATATAVDDVVCYTLDRINFTNILGDFSAAVDENVGTMILKKVSILKDLNDNQLQVISRRLTRRVYGMGKVIIKQGDDGNSFFMIATGEVSVLVNSSEVATLSAGAYFGEMALLNSEKRNATISAKTETTCLILERNDFIELLGPLERIMQDEARRRSASAGGGGFFSMFTSALTGTPQMKKNVVLSENPESAFKLSDFETVCPVGRGKFGVFTAVVETTTDEHYEMRMFEKEKILELGIESHIYDIRDMCAEMAHTFIPKLFATYSDACSVYMLYELIPGGDLWTLLYDSDNLETTALGGISITSAMFYASNILAAYTYLHEKGIAYRCLKPENIFVDVQGYLKITDFMYAKRLIGSDSATTMCGNPEYISPEMVLSKPHNRAVDIWAFGIFIFELLTRSTPFDHPTTAGIYQRVLGASEYLPAAYKPGFDQADNRKGEIARDLINQLLNSNPVMRLGMLRNGMADIWQHPFFKGLSMDAVEQKVRSAPFTPRIPDGIPVMCPADIDLEEEPEPRRYSGKFDYSGF